MGGGRQTNIYERSERGGRQIYMQADRQEGRQAGRQTNKQIVIQAIRQT